MRKIIKNLITIFCLVIMLMIGVVQMTSDIKTVDAAGADWFDARWEYRIKIIINSTQVHGPHVDFPVRIDLDDLPVEFFDNVKSDGSDIVVTDSDGITKVPRELVWIDYNTEDGELYFLAPTFSGGTSDPYYIYFGSDETESNSEQVWVNYRFVYHFNEDPSVTQILDSSPNNLHATANGSMTNSDLVSTPLGFGLDFDGTDDYLQILDSFDPADFGLSVYARPDDITSVSLFNRTAAAGSLTNWSHQLRIDSANDLQAYTVTTISNYTHTLNTNEVSGTYGYYATSFSFGGGSPSMSIAKNGQGIPSTLSVSGSLWAGGDRYNIGSQTGGAMGFFDGVIDELRFKSNTNLPTSYTRAEYNNYTSGTFFTSFTTESSTISSEVPFFDERWLFRKKITIDSTRVSDDVTDFPVYVDLSDLGSHFFNNVKTDGSDIVITKNNGVSELPRELVSINTGSSTGELWFKAPLLSSSFDSEFYIYYGNPDAAEINDTATWSNGYNMVLHMEENPTPAGTDEILDSSGTGNHGHSGSAMTIANSTTDAVMGRGLDFNANANQFVSIPNNATLYPNPITFSIWAKSDTPTWNTYGWIMSKNSATANGYLIHPEGGFTYVTAYMRNAAAWAQVTSLQSNANNWHHYLVTYNGSNAFEYYVDGVLIGSAALTSPNWSLNNLSIGRDFAVAGRNGDGKVDEARVMNRYLSAGWITTEFNNQSNPSSFYFISGSEIIANRIILENEATSTPTDITLIFNTNTDITPNSLIRYSYDTAFTIGGTGLLTMSDMSMVCDDDGDVGGSSVNMNAVTVDSQGSGYFILDVNTDTCANYTILTINGAGGQQFSTPSVQGNYEWSYNLDADANGLSEESYIILAYVIDGSEVNVVANVGSTLEFQLFEPNSDTQFDNTCNLGLLSINTIKTCVYDIATSVSSPTGVSIEIATDGDFRDGQGNIVSYCAGGTCDQDSVNGVTVGSEEYGYQVTDNGGGTYIIVNSFDIADQPLPVDPTLLAITTESGSGTNVGSSAFRMEVTHKVAINEGSIRGLYGHIVRYTVYTN